MKISVVIPVYNEEATLGDIVAAVLATPYEKELIMVDDCSTDRSAESAMIGDAWAPAEIAAQVESGGVAKARNDTLTTLVLALLAACAFGLTIATLLLLEFLNFLPKGIDTIFFICVVSLGLVVGRALFERILSLPAVYRGEVPVVRHRRV